MAKIKEKHLVSRRMSAVIFHGPQDLRLEQVAIPELQLGEILIRIGAALTCGTDFKAYRQGHPVLLNHRLPSPFGHEFSGTLIEKAADVTHLEVGQRVVAANSAPCTSCYYCAKSLPNLCENRFLLNGAYAECIVVPANIVKHNVYKLDDNISFKTAAMAEPLACVVRAYDLLELQPGQNLLVLGTGFMGSLFIQLAVAKGIRVTAIGRSHEKLDLAKKLGASDVLSTLGLDNHQELLKMALNFSPKGRGFDATVEAIGQPETWKLAVDLVRAGGSVCFYGGCKQGTKVELDTARLHYEELKLFGAFHHTPKHFKEALQLLADDKINTRLLVAPEDIPLVSLPEHFREHKDRPFIKTAVTI